ALMIGAWVFLASLGIVAARYYKPVWKQDLCSLKVWFQIHRTCMVLVFCCCVAGFVVIFLEVEDWVEIEQKPSYLEGHPIMGVIVTGLCVLNVGRRFQVYTILICVGSM
ncbi:ferric-chelate reductase 1, partial [Elysia marginata]